MVFELILQCSYGKYSNNFYLLDICFFFPSVKDRIIRIVLFENIFKEMAYWLSLDFTVTLVLIGQKEVKKSLVPSYFETSVSI